MVYLPEKQDIFSFLSQGFWVVILSSLTRVQKHMIDECTDTRAQAHVHAHISYKHNTPSKPIQNQTHDFLGSGAS